MSLSAFLRPRCAVALAALLATGTVALARPVAAAAAPASSTETPQAANVDSEAADPWQLSDTLKTDLGTLRIFRNAEENRISVRLDARTLVEYEGVFVDFHKPTPRKSRLIALVEETDASGCILTYRVLDLSQPETPKLTGEFGNCTSKASKVRYVENGMQLVFPGFHGGAEASQREENGKKQVYDYRDGEVWTTEFGRRLLAAKVKFPKTS